MSETLESTVDQKHTGRGWHGDSAGHANAGKKGGATVSANREHMALIGRRGGSKVAQNREHMAEIGRKGGAKVSQDRQHMAEIGRKGGEHN
ncbi:MAG: hypothetical protein ABJA67_12455 [Chthonomonadales bacterium]